MTLRAKLVLWLGKKLGVMEDAKPEPKQEKKMELTANDLLIVIGEQTLEIKALRIQNQAQAQRLRELEPKADPVLKAVE